MLKHSEIKMDHSKKKRPVVECSDDFCTFDSLDFDDATWDEIDAAIVNSDNQTFMAKIIDFMFPSTSGKRE